VRLRGDTYTSLYKSFEADNKFDEWIQKCVEKKLAKYPEPPHSVEKMLDRTERHWVLPLKGYAGELYQSGIQISMSERKEERERGGWNELDKRPESNNKRTQLKKKRKDGKR
jgi:hypothetical protein